MIAEVKLTVVPAQTAPDGVGVIMMAGVTIGFTCIVIEELIAVSGVAHVALLVRVQVITSPSAGVTVYIVSVLTLAPFFFQRYVGALPVLVAVRVNVTEVPAQTVSLGVTEILTVGVNNGFTVIVIAALTAVSGVAQAALLVSRQVYTSPVAAEVVVNELPVPTPIPFLYQIYAGAVPPLTGVAVNVTEVPAQIAPAGLAVSEIEGVTSGITVI